MSDKMNYLGKLQNFFSPSVLDCLIGSTNHMIE